MVDEQSPANASRQGNRPPVFGEDIGYRKTLRPRQIQMIAIGGAIGTGLFLGAGSRLHTAGPLLFMVYAVCGVFAFFVVRALGELVLHRPTSGSFVSYSREFYGERTAFVAGWMYFGHWAMTSIVDVTAIATYMHYWSAFATVPQWIIALMALAVVLAMNVISVELFGELEFWASMIKVAALIAFLAVGLVFLIGHFPLAGQPTGPVVVTSHGGFLPSGSLSLVLVTSGVVFAYGSIELVGTAAGETADPQRVMPRAINSVIARIAVFYVGSITLLTLLVPTAEFSAHESPFVTFFAKAGIPGSGTIMNIVVITAALSNLNAGLYSNGRIARSMAANGSGPRFTARLSRRGVPYGGILLTAAITLLGVGLNAIVPQQAFEIVLNMSALGIIASWGIIVLCQLKLVRRFRAGLAVRPNFRLPGSPWTGYATLVFRAGVLVLTALDYPLGTYTVATIPAIIPLLIVGWRLVRKRVYAMAGSTSTNMLTKPAGDLPVVDDSKPEGGNSEDRSLE